MKLIILLILILTINYCYADDNCYTYTNAENCLESNDGCSWCPSMNQCGVYDSCKQKIRINDTFYDCSDVEYNSEQEPCLYFENMFLGFCFTISTLIVIMGFCGIFSCYYKVEVEKRKEYLVPTIIGACFFGLGLLMILVGIGTWIAYNFTNNEACLITTAVLFVGFIGIFGIVILILVLFGIGMILFSICLGCGSSFGRKCYYKIPWNPYNIKGTITKMANEVSYCFDTPYPMLGELDDYQGM